MLQAVISGSVKKKSWSKHVEDPCKISVRIKEKLKLISKWFEFYHFFSFKIDSFRASQYIKLPGLKSDNIFNSKILFFKINQMCDIESCPETNFIELDYKCPMPYFVLSNSNR